MGDIVRKSGSSSFSNDSSFTSTSCIHTLSVWPERPLNRYTDFIKEMKKVRRQQQYTHTVFCARFSVHAFSRLPTAKNTRASQSDCDISVLDPLNFITYDIHSILWCSVCCTHTILFFYLFIQSNINKQFEAHKNVMFLTDLHFLECSAFRSLSRLNMVNNNISRSKFVSQIFHNFSFVIQQFRSLHLRK